jgi:hypothetical protein
LDENSRSARGGYDLGAKYVQSRQFSSILWYLKVSLILHTTLFGRFRDLVAKLALLSTSLLVFALFMKVVSMRTI